MAIATRQGMLDTVAAGQGITRGTPENKVYCEAIGFREQIGERRDH